MVQQKATVKDLFIHENIISLNIWKKLEGVEKPYPALMLYYFNVIQKI